MFHPQLLRQISKSVNLAERTTICSSNSFPRSDFTHAHNAIRHLPTSIATCRALYYPSNHNPTAFHPLPVHGTLTNTIIQPLCSSTLTTTTTHRNNNFHTQTSGCQTPNWTWWIIRWSNKGWASLQVSTRTYNPQQPISTTLSFGRFSNLFCKVKERHLANISRNEENNANSIVCLSTGGFYRFLAIPLVAFSCIRPILSRLPAPALADRYYIRRLPHSNKYIWVIDAIRYVHNHQPMALSSLRLWCLNVLVYRCSLLKIE